MRICGIGPGVTGFPFTARRSIHWRDLLARSPRLSRQRAKEDSMAGIDILAGACSGANAAFLSDLYARWVENPGSVDPSFSELFEALNDEARSVLMDAEGASWAPRQISFEDAEPVVAKKPGKPEAPSPAVSGLP